MKAFWLLVLFLFVCEALMCLSHSTLPGMPITGHGNDVTMAKSSRKLKEKSEKGNMNLEDYSPIDPAPSSMTSIRPGPIQHGTPLMPYIPKPPSPPGPDHPNLGGFPSQYSTHVIYRIN